MSLVTSIAVSMKLCLPKSCTIMILVVRVRDIQETFSDDPGLVLDSAVSKYLLKIEGIFVVIQVETPVSGPGQCVLGWLRLDDSGRDGDHED